MKFIAISFWISCLFGFCSFIPIIEFWDYADSVVENNTKELKKKKNLDLYRTGGGGGKEEIRIFALGYQSNHNDEILINDARKLYVEITEGLIQQVNREKSIRPYLQNYPFTSENIDLSFAFNINKDKGIHSVFKANNQIFYEKWQNNTYTTVHKETYEDAKILVQKELGYMPAFVPKNRPNFKKLKNKELSYYQYDQGKPVEIEVKKALDVFARKQALDNQLQFVNLCEEKFVGNENIGWSIHFASDQQKTINQMRPIVVQIIDSFFAQINENPIFKEYMLFVANFWKEVDPNITMKNLGFKIAFWNEDIERPQRPYLAQIRVANEKIYYYYADPETQALKEPYIEDFEKARSKLKA